MIQNCVTSFMDYPIGHRFGSAGLSRRSTLMDKALEFNSLYELIKNFDEAYKDCGHRLVKVKAFLTKGVLNLC